MTGKQSTFGCLHLRFSGVRKAFGEFPLFDVSKSGLLVKEPGAMASTENMPPLPEAIAALKDEGNGFFRAGDFLKAAGSYTKALKVRPIAHARASRLAFSNLAFVASTIC